MNNTLHNNGDISLLGLFFGICTLIIPVLILLRFNTGLIKPLLTAFGRMIIQLFFVGFYLKYIFDINSIILNFLWIIIMIISAGFSVSKRSNLEIKYFVLPLIFAISCNVIINYTIYSILIIDLNSMTSARYLIPVMGMIIGNTLTTSIVGIRSYVQSSVRNEEEFRFNLMLGADKKEAISKFISIAMREAFNPVIASTAVIGLIWLPGMMTGQILGGSNPLIAIKYQIVIIITIFVGSVITVYVAILMIRRIIYDDYGNIRRDKVNML